MTEFSQSELNERLRRVFENAGYRRYKMSKFEEYDLYADNKDFLASKSVITFTDLDGRLMALKPDVTLSIVKNFREGGDEKVYYHENVYRGFETGFKEISQAGLECIGEVDEYCVCEVLSLAAKSLMTISESCELDISHLGILCELFDKAGLSREGKAAALRLMGEKNRGELSALLKSESKDSALSGLILELSGLDDKAGEAAKFLRETLVGAVSEDSLELFCDTCEFLSEKFGDSVRVDFSTVGDLNYYSGIIFKGFVSGVPSSVLSGGQYNGLMRKMKKSAKAIGFALYLDLLEPLFNGGESYDADILLTYKTGDSLRSVYNAAEKLAAGGKSVCVMKQSPRDMRFKEIYSLSDGGEAVREG